jgi:hypothetical protein
MLRFLNMFVLIGIALIAVSILGFATGGRFLYEPGQDQSQYTSLFYLGAGVMMLVNGYVSIKNAPPAPVAPPSHPTPNETEVIVN